MPKTLPTSDQPQPRLYAQDLGQNHRMKEYRRLSNFSLFEFIGTTLEHYIGNREAENLVCLIKKSLRTRVIFIQVFSHSSELGSLTRENICFFHNSLKFRVRDLLCLFLRGKGITITAIFQNSAKRKFHHLYINMVQIGDSPSLYHIVVIYFSHDI